MTSLTVEALADATSFRELSEDDYITLQNKIFTKNNENVNEFLRFAKSEYNYTEEVAAATDEVSVAITAAYDAVSKGVLRFAIENPDATADQIQEKGDALIEAQADAFKAAKREGYLRYLDNTGDGAVPYSFPIDPDNPVESIRDFMRGFRLTDAQEGILLGRIRVLKSSRFKAQWQQ